MFFKIIKELKNSTASCLYINSIFSFWFSIYPLFIESFFIKKHKVIIAPRGMLQEGAINIKFKKKVAVIKILKFFGIYKNIWIHATDAQEKRDCMIYLGVPENRIQVISNIPSVPNSDFKKDTKKEKTELKLIYVARISAKKNLKAALEVILKSDSNLKISLDIYGPEESNYKSELKDLINKTSQKNHVQFLGDLKFDEVFDTLKKYHVYILPTQGENFGHSIFEALSAGLPVIISDQTPWRDLAPKKVGFDLSLAEPEAFVTAIEYFASMGEQEFNIWSESARNYALEFLENQNFKENYTRLFTKPTTIGFIAPIPEGRYKGGITVFSQNVLNHMDKWESDNIDFQFINTCHINRGDKSTGKLNVSNIFNYLIFLFRSFKIIRKRNLKILHIHTSIQLSQLKEYLSAYLYKKLFQTKNIIHIHYAEPNEFYASRRLVKFQLKLLDKGADKILVLSEKVKSHLVGLGIDSSKIQSIQNFHTQQVAAQSIAHGALIKLIFIGAITRHKGFEDLIKVLATLNQKNWILHVAGNFIDDSFRADIMTQIIQNKIDDKVIFHGYVEEPKKSEIMESADVMVLPSYGEGMPLTILDALEAGNAIVTTNVGANSEFFSGITNLIEPGNLDSLSSEITRLITDTKYLIERKKQAKALAEQFSFERYKEIITPIYNNLINS
ncbi:MAG: glycosyltransferase [Flavobacteriales bacterium]|nr:glycosyltransferase [Flavobacteriales bacterium]